MALGETDNKVAPVCALFAFSLGKLLDAVFLGMKDADRAPFYNVIRILLRILLCIPVYLHAGDPIRVVALAIAVETLITAAFRWMGVHRRYPGLLRIRREPDRTGMISFTALFRNAAPMCGTGLVAAFEPYLDKAILSTLVSLSEVGIYRAAANFAQLNTIFVAPFVAFWPYISKLYREERLDELRHAYKTITLIITAVMLPFMLMLVELSNVGLSLFGKELPHQGTPILVILAVGTMIDALVGPADAVLRMTRHATLSLVINFVMLAVFIGLCFPLVARYGILGAAIAKSATMIMANLVSTAANYFCVHIFPFTTRHAALVASAVAIFALRHALPLSSSTTGFAILIALAQAALFLALAAIILRKQMTPMFADIKGYIKTR